MTLRIIWIFSPFLTGTPILRKFVKLDVDIQVCCFWLETILWSKFCFLTLKFVTYNNSNILSSIVMFTFAIFDWKRPFWAILVHKISFLFLSLIWYRDKFEYVELDYGSRFFSVFEPEISILVKPVLNYQTKICFSSFLVSTGFLQKSCCENFGNFSGKHQWQRFNNFTILINWTEHSGLNKVTLINRLSVERLSWRF